ncbi:MAG: DUF192 domain-containing protein [Lactobacillaceae bacterium]|jgi:uncharacterized membrane protein (UPF0127 family)|nr:DUF192 domain-containing protein [Lactobacillaceae bacterium]
MKNILKIFLVCLLIISCKGKDESNLAVVTENGEVRFVVQNAQEPDELMNGLMLVENMPENEGMIFDLSGIQGAAMWMKDTLIPLDMLFIDENGSVVWIYENAQPMSEDIIMSPVPFDLVLELNGGQVQKHNIKIGDKIKHEFLNNFDKE